MIKPDGVQRRLVGEVISRLEKAGLKIIAIKILKVTQEQAERHYAIHKGKTFYDGLIKFITSSPVLAMIVEGRNAIKHTRRLVGVTNPSEATPGSIRGDFALEIGRNVVHAGDSAENALKEYRIYFEEKEIVNYQRIDEIWLYE
jgi:nucleoside-diphosphate kinase